MIKLLYFLIFNLFFVYINTNAKEDIRIVTLSPNLTEIVYSLGLGKHLVGDTLQCDYPEQAKFVNKVGEYINPNIEKILSVNPNYVLATIGNPRSILNKLKLQGIHVIEVDDPKTAGELPASIEKIADKLGVQNQGKKIATEISQAISELTAHKVNNKKFLFVIQYNPIYSLSNDTWIGNLFTLAGYTNVVGTSKVPYPIIAPEYLIKNVPDIVFAGFNSHLTLEENKEIEFLQLEKIFGTNVAQKIKIIFLPKDILVRPGPRVIDGIHFIESLSEHE